MSLTERVDKDRRQTDLTPIKERRVEERRVPAWLERKQRIGLPPKDMTGCAA
jgi:hypothetical protein